MASRTKNSIRNSIASLALCIVTMIASFITQTFLIRIMGKEYVGLNGLFTNILSVLSLFELGIGSAIIYNLYEPVANNDIDKIASLLKFYKKSYNIIAVIVLAAGLIIAPIIPIFVGKISIDVNIYLIYSLFLLSTISSYILSYKRSIIIAYQKNYIISIVHFVYIAVLSITQILILTITNNFYLFLSIKIILLLLENASLHHIANRLFPAITKVKTNPPDKKTEKQIFKKVKALLFHKIGSILVLSTDNIIISMFFNVATVGIYSNYSLIINAANTLASEAINPTSASIGNLLIINDKKKNFEAFSKIRFINFILTAIGGTLLLLLIQPFISIWAGKDYLFPTSAVIVLIINFYQKTMRRSYGAFKDAAGLWEQDRYIPLLESLINIVASIILLKLIGVTGVFVGTILSGLILWCYSYPKIVYKKLFDRGYVKYAKETIGYIFLFAIISTLSYGITKKVISAENIIIYAIICIVTTSAVTAIVVTVFLHNTKTYQYFKKQIINKIKRITTIREKLE